MRVKSTECSAHALRLKHQMFGSLASRKKLALRVAALSTSAVRGTANLDANVELALGRLCSMLPEFLSSLVESGDYPYQKVPVCLTALVLLVRAVLCRRSSARFQTSFLREIARHPLQTMRGCESEIRQHARPSQLHWY